MTSEAGPLRAARAVRGWSQAQAAEALSSVAAARGIAVAGALSLKTQLSRWENQHVVPDEQYRALLRELYDCNDVELGFAEPPTTGSSSSNEADALRAGLATSAALDEAAIALLRAQLQTTRALDDRLGAVAVVDSAQAQLSHLEHALAHAVHRRARLALARLVAEAGMLAGRVARDLSWPAMAWRHYETAKGAGREAESPLLVSCAMVEQAGVLLDVASTELALEMIEHASVLSGGEASPMVRAWFAASEGDALAAAGAAQRARSAFQSAERQLAARPARVDLAFEPPFVEFDLSALHRHRGHALRVLRDDESAIAELEEALRAGGGSAREVAGVHVDLAHALSATGHESAREHARSARELAVRIGSARLTARLDAGPGDKTPTER